MALLTFGVVGPSDLVPRVAEAVDATAQLKALPLPYKGEQETVDIIRDNAEDVDAWLFTGVVPHEIATAENVVDLPAEHVSYSGVTLLAALLKLQRAGADLHRVSIDVLQPSEVAETLAEAGLPPETAMTMVYEPTARSADVVEFHRAARREGASVAITCLRSAYDELRKEMPVVRLAPAPRDIRDAVEQLVLLTRSRHHSDAQVAIGLVQLPRADTGL
jgi:hypothetical protein